MRYSVFTRDKKNQYDTGNTFVCDNATDLFNQLKLIKEMDEDIVVDIQPYQSSAEFISASMGEQVKHILRYEPERMCTYRKQERGVYFYVVEFLDNHERRTLRFETPLLIGREYLVTTTENKDRKIKILWKTR